jgi:LysM repeat protein
VAWLGWAAFALSVVLEILGRLRHRPTLRIPGFAVPRRAAAGLFTAIAIMIGSGGMAVGAFAATPTVPAAPPAAVVVIGNPVPVGDAPASTLVYHVAHGDNLGSIAQRFLGSFEAYPRLVAANSSLITHGPDNIKPGWTLSLPSGARDTGVRSHATGALSSTLLESTPATGAPTAVSPTIGTPVPAGSGVVTDTITGPVTAVPMSDSTPMTPPLVTFGHVTSLTPEQVTATNPVDDGVSPLLLAAALAMTTGVLGAHLLVRQRRRRSAVRSRLLSPTSASRAVALSTEPDADLASASELSRLDLALRDLASLLGDRDQGGMPDIMGSWIAEGAVHLMLTEPCPAPPAPWVAHGLMWTLPAHVPTHTYFAGTTPPLPALVTVGGGDDRTVLLDLERLGVVTIGGDPDGAHDLLRHVGAELSHGIWSEGVTVGIAGFGDEDARRLTELGQGRVHASTSIADALDRAGRWINEAHERLAGLGVSNVLSGRVCATPAEARRLSPYALLIAQPDAEDLERLERVDAYLAGLGRGQLAIAATQRPGTHFGAGSRYNKGRWPLTVGTDHTVTMEFLDTRVPAVAMGGRELASLADASHAPVAVHHAPTAPDVPVGRHRMPRRQPVA